MLKRSHAAWPDAGRREHVAPDDLARLRSFVPYFDCGYYRQGCRAADMLAPASDIEAFDHWVRVGVPEGISPSPLIVESFYGAANADLQIYSGPLFLHYVLYGRFEGRVPNRWVDPGCLSDPAAGDAVGSHAGSLPASPRMPWRPHPWLERLFPQTVDGARYGCFLALLEADRTSDLDLRDSEVQALATMFDPALYREARGLRADLSTIDLFIDFLHEGIRSKVEFPPFFDSDHYASTAPSQGEDAGTPLRWLRVDRHRRIVPTPWFDDSHYLAVNSDVAQVAAFGFWHLLISGLAEGRSPNPWLSARSEPFSTEREAAHGSEAALFISGRIAWYPLQQVERFLPQGDVAARRSATLTLVRAGRAGGLDLSRDEILLALAMFNADDQLRESAPGGDDRQPHERLAAFLRVDIRSKIALPPFFDPTHYEAASGWHGDEAGTLFRWLRVDRLRDIVPVPWFDDDFYRDHYPPVAGGAISAYEHFILHGLEEGRSWNALCLRPGSSARPSGQGARAADVDGAGALYRRLGKRAFVLAAHMLAWNVDDASFVRELRMLLEPDGNEVGHAPFFFSADFYRAAATRAGLPPVAGSAFAHWLEHGISARVVPTEDFIEADYLTLYGDLTDATIWGFEHFILHGRAEGRRHTAGIVAAAALPSRLITHETLRMSYAVHSRTAARVANLLTTERFRTEFNALQALEPAIGDLSQYGSVLAAPLHDPLGLAHRELRDRLGAAHYDNIVCVPWLRRGGADLMAGQLAASLGDLQPNESTLVLATDHEAMEWLDVVPPSVEVVNISDLTTYLGMEQAERLLRAALVGLAPRRVFNVNSRLCWTTLQRFGQRLASRMDLYAYLFCWDRSAGDNRVGYPGFYPLTAASLSGVFVDTEFLRNDLIRLYDPYPELAERIHVLRSPPRTLPDATGTVAGRAEHEQPLVLWAGRFDRQKRFDLLQEIARRMPDVHFACWGYALLDRPPDLSVNPPNLSMRGMFTSYEELPLESCAAWLYTSAWDGMPTILVELAHRAVPIVASAVEGVPEMIRGDTGWPVTDIDDPSAYVAALRQALRSPEERRKRASALRDHARRHYSLAGFNADLKRILHEGVRM